MGERVNKEINKVAKMKLIVIICVDLVGFGL